MGDWELKRIRSANSSLGESSHGLLVQITWQDSDSWTALWTMIGSGIPSDLALSFPVTLVDVLNEPLPVAKGDGFFYEYECILDVVGECMLESMTKGAITPIDLAGQRIEFDEKIGKLLIRTHPEVIEFRFGGCFGIRVTEHIAEFLDEKRPSV